MTVLFNNIYILDYHIGADFEIRTFLGWNMITLFHEFLTIFKSRNLKSSSLILSRRHLNLCGLAFLHNAWRFLSRGVLLVIESYPGTVIVLLTRPSPLVEKNVTSGCLKCIPYRIAVGIEGAEVICDIVYRVHII